MDIDGCEKGNLTAYPSRPRRLTADRHVATGTGDRVGLRLSGQGLWSGSAKRLVSLSTDNSSVPVPVPPGRFIVGISSQCRSATGQVEALANPA